MVLRNRNGEVTANPSPRLPICRTLNVAGRSLRYWALASMDGVVPLAALPVSVKVLLENLLRHAERGILRTDVVRLFSSWPDVPANGPELEFYPVRVVMPDSSGIPVLADLSAMREAVAGLGGDPLQLNPVIPTDLVVDHSVTADVAGRRDALAINLANEFALNKERYAFLHWASRAYAKLRVAPPGVGIVHQVNLEFLSHPICTEKVGDDLTCFPDSLVGLDSHTPMINALGVLGWGVGGIEGASAMLGEPISLTMPKVVGCTLVGRLREGATGTDAVLSITEKLRKHDVVGSIVEYCGPGVATLSLPHRATIANMAPEYGATMGFFPIDDRTIQYLRGTGRAPWEIALTEAYARAQGLWGDDPRRRYSHTLEIDLAEVEPVMAGPLRPQDRHALSAVPRSFTDVFASNDRTLASPSASNRDRSLRDGDVVIASITSCTNTSNPELMVAAGLSARKAAALGLKPKPWVKTSFSPGSRVVSDYLAAAGLQEDLDTLGFHVVGYGCMTCAGASGPLQERVAKAIDDGGLIVAAVLSGNRNFEGRIHPQVRAAYLGAPALIIAYALCGSVLIDLRSEPLGQGTDGKPVYLADIWPSQADVDRIISDSIRPEMFLERYEHVFDGDDQWNALASPSAPALFRWDQDSSYLRRPPFLVGMTQTPPPITRFQNARALLILGDSVTTDHISPVGPIARSGDTADFLISRGVAPTAFHSYLARRVNHDVMMRGTFSNPRLRNEMTPGHSGPWTVFQPDGTITTVFAAAQAYRREKVPVIVIAGAHYGAGSSRDWAAKGTSLLGIKAVIAESFERIHRSNLVGMGVLPLQFTGGESRKTLRLEGSERFDLLDAPDSFRPRAHVRLRVISADGRERILSLRLRLDTERELQWYRNGGVLPHLVRHLSLRQQG
jgi:aconitate hydratase